MKRLLLSWVMFVFGFIAFAAGNKEPDPYELSFGGDLNTFIESSEINDKVLATGFNSHGIHLQSSQFFGNTNWGMVVHVGALFPYEITLSDGHTTITTNTIDFKNLFALTGIWSFPYYFINTEALSIGIGPAVNYFMISMTTDRFTGLGYYFGGGLQLNTQIRISNNWFMGIGTYALYDIYASSMMRTSYTSTSWTGWTKSIIWNPYIGIGYRLFNKKD